MVCPRCIKVVEEELQKLGVHVEYIELGRAEIDLISNNLLEVEEVLNDNGFELLKEKEDKIVEDIKLQIIQQVRESGRLDTKTPLSEILSRSIGRDYSFLSNLFSTTSGTTIEKYYIHQKVEYAKELLIYDELNNSEISNKLGYSSLAHFSNQFKNVTGLSPTLFKKQINKNRRSIDSI